MKKQSKKLTLSKSTIAKLGNSEVSEAMGASGGLCLTDFTDCRTLCTCPNHA